MISTPPGPSAVSMRVARGFKLAQATGRNVQRFTRLGREVFDVPSDHYPGVTYQVFVDEDGAWVCTCQDFNGRREPCKHVNEVLFRYFPNTAPPQPTFGQLQLLSQERYADARRFPHVPHVYEEGLAESTRRDRALQKGDAEVERLLVDLAKALNQDHPYFGEGRPPLPFGDIVLAMTLRAHHRKSMRGCQEILKRLRTEGNIAFAPCKNTLVKYNTDPESTKKLQAAFAYTVSPYSVMERDVIIDSSGWSPFFVSCWSLSEYGQNNIKIGTKWFKVHLVIGRISKAILGFVMTQNDGDGSADGTNLAPLVTEIKARGFDLRFVIADNLYLTEDNIKFCGELGATLVGPLKPKNYDKKGHPRPTIAPIHAFKVKNPELYDELCRARQPIEGVFSTEKRRDNHIAAIGTEEEREAFADGNGSSLYVSRQNEMWTRILRYNLNVTVTQQELYNRIVRYSEGTVFSHVREVVPSNPGAAA